MSWKHVGSMAAAFGLLLFVACDEQPTNLDGVELASSSHVENGHVSGGVSVTWPVASRSRGDIDLTAHDGGASSSDRGTFEWEAYDQNGDLARTMTITAREVGIDGSEARFVAEVTADSDGTLLGEWYAFYVKDGGSPGPGNDDIQWTNADTRAQLPGGGTLNYDLSDFPTSSQVHRNHQIRFTIVDGNLAVKE